MNDPQQQPEQRSDFGIILPPKWSSLADVIAQARTTDRRRRLLAAGLNGRNPGDGSLVYDPERLTDRDVDRLVAAQRKRQARLARARARLGA